jgi:hypothetical protein
VFAIANQVLLDIFAVEKNLSVGWFQQADEHFDGGAFAGAVGSEVTENLSRLKAEVDALHSEHRAVILRESSRFEHRAPSCEQTDFERIPG